MCVKDIFFSFDISKSPPVIQRPRKDHNKLNKGNGPGKEQKPKFQVLF
jgi:hypothetical protein